MILNIFYILYVRVYISSLQEYVLNELWTIIFSHKMKNLLHIRQKYIFHIKIVHTYIIKYINIVSTLLSAFFELLEGDTIVRCSGPSMH